MTDFASLLPHAGSAIMIDELVRWDEQEIRARTRTHQAPENPMLRSTRNPKLLKVVMTRKTKQPSACHDPVTVSLSNYRQGGHGFSLQR